MSGDDCVIEAKAARRQGRLVDAAALYVEAGVADGVAEADRHVAALASV